MSVAEKALTYATLILADAEVALDAEKLKAVTTAAGLTDIQPIYFSLYTKAFDGKNILDLVTNVSSGVAVAAPGAGAAAGAAAGGEAAAEEEKKEEEGEESDDDMGFGLFD
ncbi:60S acidic ribosomal protein P1 [Spiromyces aspiralis]|uniref:60S acidic ribosomal protein P1 n=1 Tax=Spiromyces aspiralis TaxID=68401 RepID=A0ACC1HHA6_9FUNG|nr:60S acidic ribosomal protein P1 [Spiromyces aspiralis]